MKKFSIKTLAAAGALAAALPFGSANAATAGQTFTVDATLTPLCTVAAFSGNINFGTYTANAAAVNQGPITAAVSCTRGLTGMTIVFDDNAGDQTSAAAVAADGTTLNGHGLLTNGTGLELRYTLTASLPTLTAGTAATGGAAGTVGSADTGTISVSGTLPQQWGAGASSANQVATQQTRTLTLTY